METFSALQETNKMLKMDREKLEQELKQAQARVSLMQDSFCFSLLLQQFFVSMIGATARPFSFRFFCPEFPLRSTWVKKTCFTVNLNYSSSSVVVDVIIIILQLNQTT